MTENKSLLSTILIIIIVGLCFYWFRQVGPGVIGLQPLIKPNENFEYSSFCPLKTPFGMMSGAYQMKLNSEEIFDATIPAFSLHATEHID